MMRWDGTRKGIEVICRWANTDYDDDPAVQYEFTGPADVQRVTVATADGDFTELHPWDLIRRADDGFCVEQGVGSPVLSEHPNPNAVYPTGMCGSPTKCQHCPSDFLCYMKAGAEKQAIAANPAP